MKRRFLLRLINLYPPYLGAGVRVRQLSAHPLAFRVEMKLRLWNRNYVGTQFGGSLYTMCDPFFMLILLEGLGPGFEVWDKAASIRFRRPGRSKVQATFRISPEEVEEIRRRVDAEGKVEPRFTVEVVDAVGEVVAEIDKTLSVRRKRAAEE